jgi:hypothetical protein
MWDGLSQKTISHYCPFKGRSSFPILSDFFRNPEGGGGRVRVGLGVGTGQERTVFVYFIANLNKTKSIKNKSKKLGLFIDLSNTVQKISKCTKSSMK